MLTLLATNRESKGIRALLHLAVISRHTERVLYLVFMCCSTLSTTSPQKNIVVYIGLGYSLSPSLQHFGLAYRTTLKQLFWVHVIASSAY